MNRLSYLWIALVLLCLVGCGADPPQAKPELVAAIKKLMTREQVTLGGPVVNSVGMVLVPIPPGWSVEQIKVLS